MAIVPARIPAGVSLELTTALTAYPAPEWELSLHLRGPAAIDIEATASGSSHVLSAAASVTTEWVPGRYWYTVRATDGEDVVEVESGEVEVLVDLAAFDGEYDGRSHVQRILAAVEAVLENRATKDQQSYRINDRELVRTPIGELLKLRSMYRAEIKAQKAANSGRSSMGRAIRVRFPA